MHQAWQIGMLFFVTLAVAMLPVAFWADRLPRGSVKITMLIGFAAGGVQILAGGPPRRRRHVIEPGLATT